MQAKGAVPRGTIPQIIWIGNCLCKIGPKPPPCATGGRFWWVGTHFAFSPRNCSPGLGPRPTGRAARFFETARRETVYIVMEFIASSLVFRHHGPRPAGSGPRIAVNRKRPTARRSSGPRPAGAQAHGPPELRPTARRERLTAHGPPGAGRGPGSGPGFIGAFLTGTGTRTEARFNARGARALIGTGARLIGAGIMYRRKKARREGGPGRRAGKAGRGGGPGRRAGKAGRGGGPGLCALDFHAPARAQ